MMDHLEIGEDNHEMVSRIRKLGRGASEKLQVFPDPLDSSIVHDFSLEEQQKIVEESEHLIRRLMNRANHGPSLVRNVSQKSDHIRGHFGVQSGGRLTDETNERLR